MSTPKIFGLVSASAFRVVLMLLLVISIPQAGAADAYADIPRLNFEFTLNATESALLTPGLGSIIDDPDGNGDFGESVVLSDLTVGENFGPASFFVFSRVGPATAFAPPPVLPEFSRFGNSNVFLLEFRSYGDPLGLTISWDGIYSLITHDTFSFASVVAQVIESSLGTPDITHGLFSNMVSNGGVAFDIPSGAFTIALPGGGVPVLLNIQETVIAVAAVAESSSLSLLGIGCFSLLFIAWRRTPKKHS